MGSKTNNLASPGFTINLNKKEDYSIPNNPGEVNVLDKSCKEVVGYNIYSHRPTSKGDSYKVNKFVFNGEEQDGLPKDLGNVKSIDVFIPESDGLEFVTRVYLAVNINEQTTDIALYFVKNAEEMWLIYLYMEDSPDLTSVGEVINLFNCPDPLELSFNHDALFKIQLDNFNSQIEEAMASYSGSGDNLWDRLTRWIQELLSVAPGWK